MDLKGRCIGENKDYVLVRTRMLQVDYEQTGPLSHKVYKKSQGRQKVLALRLAVLFIP